MGTWDDQMMSSAGRIISDVLGVAYTAAWSVSFYPQLLINWRRNSVEGLALDFVVLNPTGFLAYLVSNVALFAASAVRDEYAGRHDGHHPQVRWNDLAFAAHAFLISSLTLVQTLWLRHRSPGRQAVSEFNRAFLVLAVCAVAIATIAAVTTSGAGVAWLDVVYLLQYIKLYISFAKYVPQAYLNYVRKSTVGWSIENIICDLSGGTLSLAQLVLDSALADDWRGVTGNPGKLGLSLLSIAFDVVFLVQHFILYRHSRLEGGAKGAAGGDDERRPLLDDDGAATGGDTSQG